MFVLRFSDLFAWVGCWSSVPIGGLFTFTQILRSFDYTAFVVSVKVEIP